MSTTPYSELNLELVAMQEEGDPEKSGVGVGVSVSEVNDGKDVGQSLSPDVNTDACSSGDGSTSPVVKTGDMCCFNKREKALKRCRVNLAQNGGESMNLATFKAAFMQKIFLDNLYQLFDATGDNRLDQDEFLDFFYQKLKDERGRQFCEVIETATFAIAGDVQHLEPHTFARIFATKGVLDKLFRLMDKNSDNLVTINEAIDLIAKITVAQSYTSLTKENLEHLTKLFAENCDANNEISLENFRKIIHSKNAFFTDRVFAIFDRDGSGTVSMPEFLDAVSKFSGQSMDKKFKFLFQIYDQDGDGYVQMSELRAVMKACMDESGMKFSEDQLDDLTTALFEDADPDDTGAITAEALKNQMEKHDGILENLSNSIEKWLVPEKPVEKTFWQKLADMRPPQLSWNYFKNNHVYIIFCLLFLVVNVALFVTRMFQYRTENIYVQLARGCGQCLNFTCTLIVVLMLRKSITWLRTHGASVILPLDEHIKLHMVVGWFIFIYSVVHTVMHIANVAEIAKLKKEDDVDEFIIEWLFTTESGIGWIGKVAFPTGVALLVILVIMVVCSQPCVRQHGRFEVFYWTHRLYIAFFVLLFVHGPRFWQWFLVPGFIYAIELVVRFVQRRGGHGRTSITEAVLLASKVTHLVIKRPLNFHFRPGDYIFIKIPSIAKYEWHPFTLSGAPEQDDVIWLHIRAVGEWTNQLYTHFDKQLKKLAELQNPTIVELKEEPSKSQSIFSRGSKFFRNSARLKLSPNGNINRLTKTSGYENMSYTNAIDGEGKVTSESTDGSASEGRPPLTSVAARNMEKQRIAGARSLPILEAPPLKRTRTSTPHRGVARSTSHHVVGSLRLKPLAPVGVVTTPSGSPASVRMRSKGQSFRHMRRKPRAVPMVSNLSSSVIEEEEESTDMAEVNQDEAPSSILSVTFEEYPITKPPPPTVAIYPTLDEDPSKVEDGALTAVTVDNSAGIIAPMEDEEPEDPFFIEKPLEVFIDGPYGAPSSHIFRAEHAVLVGTGIGVTPFASILQSIMRRYWEARQTCPKCNHNWINEVPSSYLNLKKVDFFWINRDQKSFEWFVNLLTELEIEQAEQGGVMERFLDMHMYITSALQKSDMKAVGLHMALDLMHEKEKRDLITGLKTRTQAGRPNWNKVFRQLAQQNKGKVTVFFCGQPLLARTLKLKCDEFGFSFKKEVF